MLADTARVLAMHWPKLLGIFLIGETLRAGFLWLAALASNVSGTIAYFILPLAPLASLASWIFMLRTPAASLPALHEATSRRRYDLTVLVTTMMPFLGLYAAQGLFALDVKSYLIDVVQEQYLDSPLVGASRIAFVTGWPLAALIVGALALRRLFEVHRWGKRLAVLGLLEAYLEALWMVPLGSQLKQLIDRFIGWLQGRQISRWLGDLWQRTLELGAGTGDATTWLGSAWSWLSAMTLSALLLPLLWLAAATMVAEPDLDDLQQGSAEARGRASLGSRRWPVSPGVAKWLGYLAGPVARAVIRTWGGLRRIVAAGIAPALIFCAVFLVLAPVNTGVAWAVNAAIGPRNSLLGFALEPYISVVVRLVHFVVAMALLAAAVNVLIELGRRDRHPIDNGKLM